VKEPFKASDIDIYKKNFKTGAMRELIGVGGPSKGCSVRLHGKEGYAKKDRKKESG